MRGSFHGRAISDSWSRRRPDDRSGTTGKPRAYPHEIFCETLPFRPEKRKRTKEEHKLRSRYQMGRYKSVLMAEKDARDFPHHVGVPVPPTGLGKRMDVIAAWLDTNIGPDWRSHGNWEKGVHTSRYMFRSIEDARAFSLALTSGQL